ncbi:MAG: MFS transporter [Pirellulales bacterium]
MTDSGSPYAPTSTTSSRSSGSSHGSTPHVPNAMRLLWGGFLAILAAGVGFAIRGGILDNWGTEFGFSGTELGLIGSAGFTGFCFGIIIGGVIVDKVGYGKLVFVAFLLHVLSALVAFGATSGMEKQTAFTYLFLGTFLFALANGTLEAVANPLVATLFPENRTHYLNILHASWPLGMVLGGAAGWILDDLLGVPWKVQLALFLIPTVIYGLMFLGQKYPKSEASEKGLSLGEMFRDVGIMGSAVIGLFVGMFMNNALGPLMQGLTGNDFFVGGTWGYISIGIGIVVALAFSGLSGFSLGAWLLFVLFLIHILVGAVELGTDGWIQNITGNILSSQEGKILFVFTSLTMFLLRFCADFIEKRIGFSPVAILVTCALLACVGLNLVAGINSFAGALFALTIYGIGKTFFWPTMLAVASDRFPRTGAVAISIMGGLGMMSAGLLGSVGLGYAKDRFAGESLKAANAAVFEEYKSDKPSGFLFFEPSHGLDGKKLGEVNEKLNTSRARIIADGGDASKADTALTDNEKLVIASSITGDRQTLRADSFIPATMAVAYLLLLVYFKAIGGYKRVTISEEAA